MIVSPPEEDGMIYVYLTDDIYHSNRAVKKSISCEAIADFDNDGNLIGVEIFGSKDWKVLQTSAV